MNAVVADRPGGPEVLELRTLPAPRPGPGQLAIKVAYAGLNFAEVMGRRGDLGPRDDPFVPGLEVAGHVCELGAAVTDFALGQPVCAFVDEGGYAQQAIADARLTFTIPDDTDAGLMLAACTPTVGITAWSVLHRAARLSAGETVLVHAAAGGLGTLIGQLARELGAARVIGTVGSPAKVAYARAFGYHDVLLRERFATDLAGVDVIIDSIGGAVREQSLDLLKPYGRLVVCGNATAEPDFRAGAGDLMSRNAAVVGYSIGRLATRAPLKVREAGLEVLRLLHSGAARIDITEVIELDDIRDAHERLENGRTQGKLVMRIDGSA